MKMITLIDFLQSEMSDEKLAEEVSSYNNNIILSSKLSSLLFVVNSLFT